LKKHKKIKRKMQNFEILLLFSLFFLHFYFVWHGFCYYINAGEKLSWEQISTRWAKLPPE